MSSRAQQSIAMANADICWSKGALKLKMAGKQETSCRAALRGVLVAVYGKWRSGTIPFGAVASNIRSWHKSEGEENTTGNDTFKHGQNACNRHSVGSRM